MEKAQYPQRTCRLAVDYFIPIDGEQISRVGNCELPAGHEGPHATLSSTALVRARDTWEQAHPDWKIDGDAQEGFV